MNVIAVADDLGRDLARLEHRPDHAGRAVRSGVIRLNRWVACVTPAAMAAAASLVGRARVADRHEVAARRAAAGPVEPAVELGRHGDDGDARRSAWSITHDVVGRERAAGVAAPSPRAPPYVLQAVRRLRAVPLRVDEVALEMCAPAPRAASGRRRRARPASRAEEHRRASRDRRPRTSGRNR